MTDNETRELLRAATNDDLSPLVEYILKARTERLSSTEAYKAHHPDHRAYSDEILDEIRLFGGNSFVNLWRRGEGPEYRDVLVDVARKLKASVDANAQVSELEEAIIGKLVKDAVASAEGADREALMQAFAQAGVDHRSMGMGSRAGGALVAYKLSEIIAQAVARSVLGHGIGWAANAAAMRAIGVVTGPVGWLLMGIWTAVDVAGPAYRVTIPCVCHIAYLRLKAQYDALAGIHNDDEIFADD
jgi:uncharacterized protein YaaW (UPF0174 family)